MLNFSNFLRLWEELFLLRGGGSKGGGSSTQTVQNFSPQEAAQRAKVQSEAGRLYDATASTVSTAPYPGAQVVPYSQDSLNAQGLARTAANTQVQSTIPQLMDATKFGLSDVLDVKSNPYLQSAIEASVRPITESYTDAGGVLSNIRSNSIANGGQGQNTRQGIAEGIAAGRYADAIGDTASRVASEGYGKGLDTFSRTLGLTPQTMQAMQMPSELYSAVGGQNEGLRQAQENYSAQSRDWDLNSSWVPLQNYANIVYGGTGPQGSTTTQSGGGPSPNRAMGAAGGALAGYSALAGSAMGAKMGAWAGPVGAVGGAILGGLFS